MEISLIGSYKVKLGRSNFLGFCNINNNNLKNAQICSRKSKICFVQISNWKKSSIRLTIKAAAQSEAVVSGDSSTSGRSSKPVSFLVTFSLSFMLLLFCFFLYFLNLFLFGCRESEGR